MQPKKAKAIEAFSQNTRTNRDFLRKRKEGVPSRGFPRQLKDQ
jgi:hypothetical protein